MKQPELQVLKRFFEGKYSQRDYEIVKKSLGDDVLDENVKKILFQHWSEFNSGDPTVENVDHMLYKINHRIRLEENKRKKELSLWQTFQRIAAVIIFPITLALFSYIYFQPKETLPPDAYAEIQCPLGVRTKFELPDGSTGFLNSGSKLRYPVNFNKRDVELIGEAYFCVTHDENSSFSVNTKNLKIKVLGTKFNVAAYEDENVEEVVLKSGKVDVYSEKGQKIESLVPNQQLALDINTNKYYTSEVEALQYTSWKDGKLVFRNENMKQVARRLGRWYNVNIVIADPELENYSYHATFVDEQFDEVMKLISLTTPVTFVETERSNSQDGVYEKRNIVLRMNTKRMSNF